MAKKAKKPADARERGWREQAERRKALKNRDLIRVKPETLEGIEALMKQDGETQRATMVSLLVDAELLRRARKR